jgi:hypothetical protein
MKFRPVLTIALLATLTLPAVAQMQEEVPAYNAKPPAARAKLPPILTPAKLSPDAKKYSFQTKAYLIAAHIQRTLHQLPCYCHCDQHLGHNSLRSCFADEHGAHCSTCMQELYYANQMLKQGKTAKQIREGIVRGEFNSIDLTKV